MPRRNRPQRSRRRRDAASARPPENALRTETQRLACKRKERFATQREADDAVYRNRMEGTPLGAYHCAWCDGWHLTSREPKGV